MADPRQTARAWLAERLWHDGLMHVMSPEDLADAILSADGVRVHNVTLVDDDYEPTGCRTVIELPVRLPVQPIGETT